LGRRRPSPKCRFGRVRPVDAWGCAISEAILREGETCWRTATAGRAAVLTDGAAYFGALREALLQARRRVYIVGWDIDSRTRLVGPSGRADDGWPETLGPLLTELVRRRPQLKVHVLLWDFAVLYALEREPLPGFTLRWRLPRRIQVCLDDRLPFGSAHHQKIVVVDDRIAFSGGLDLTVRRWDTCDHRPDDPARVDPDGKPYKPFHDVQMLVDGEAAAAVAELARQRWRACTCVALPREDAAHDPWPASVAPDLRDVRVGIARTLPFYEEQPEVREVEALFHAGIDAAERSIYIENQFLTVTSVAERLARRLAERPELEAVLVAPHTHHTWLEEQTMLAGRVRFAEVLRRAGVAGRVRFYYPEVGEGDARTPVMVHSKVMAVDDRFLRVGSANLANRSMGTDTEADLAVQAEHADARQALKRVRDRLIAEHLGVDAEDFAAAEAETGSLIAAIERLNGAARGLRPIEDGAVAEPAVAAAVGSLADPERPIAAAALDPQMFGGRSPERLLGRFVRIGGVVLAVLALLAFWRYGAPESLTDPERLQASLGAMTGGVWGPALVLGAYVAAGLLVFPITVLIAATAAIFEPWSGLCYALVGSMLSALVGYLVGLVLQRGFLRKLFGPRLNRLRRALARRGILGVAAVRMLPLAPFTVVNVAAGGLRVPFGDYVIGSAIGMAPGIVMLTAFGQQTMRMLTDPSAAGLALLAAIVVGWMAAAAGLQAVATRLQRRAAG